MGYQETLLLSLLILAICIAVLAVQTNTLVKAKGELKAYLEELSNLEKRNFNMAKEIIGLIDKLNDKVGV